MDKGNAVARNPRLLFWGRLFLETKTTAAVIVLFYLHRGITLSDVFWLNIVWSLVSIVAEVPSGYLADRIGRKAMLLLSAAFILASDVQMMLAHGFFDFSLTFVLMSLGYACRSGTEEAMLYDSLRDLGLERDMVGQNGKLASAQFAAKMFLPLFGSYIARDLLEWQFLVLIGTEIVFALASIVVLSRLEEPSCRIGPVGIRRDIFGQSLRTIRDQPWLLKAMFSRTLVFMVGFLLYRVYQPILSERGFTVMAIGLYYSVSRGTMFFLNRRAGAIASLFGTACAVRWTAVVGTSLVGLVLCLDSVWVVFVALCLGLAEATITLRDSLFSRAIQKRIDSRCRATTVSNLNCLKHIIDIPAALLASWLVGLSVDYVLMEAVVLGVIALIVFPMRQRDFAE